MAQTKEGAQKMRRTMINKLGSEEAWRQWMATRGSKGGAKTKSDGCKPKGFAAMSPEKRAEAGSKGGKVSRRPKPAEKAPKRNELTKDRKVFEIRDLQSKLTKQRLELKAKRTPFVDYKPIEGPMFTSKEIKEMYAEPKPWYKRMFS